MSIVPLKSVVICGLEKEKLQVLDRLQRLGCLHLLPVSRPAGDGPPEESNEPLEADRALKYLLGCPVKRHQRSEDEGFVLSEIVARTLGNERLARETTDRRDYLLRRLAAAEPWGDFDLPPLETLGGLRFWFYVIPHHKLARIAPQVVYQVVHRNHRVSFVVVISREEPPVRDLPVARSHLGAASYSRLKRQLEASQIELDELNAERESLTQYIYLISGNRARARDEVELHRASNQTLDREGIFAIQGWMPCSQVETLCRFAAKHGLAILFRDPAPGDNPPTLLENPAPLAGGEEMLSFYQVPAYREWDPSSSVFFSFAVFFAMILSDAGYALLLGAVVLLFWKRMGRSRLGRRLRVLSAAVAGASLVYGMLAGSYFGANPAPGSPLAGVHLLRLDRTEEMMRISIAVGCAHLALAHALGAWHWRRSSLALASLGWIAVIAGAFTWWLSSSAASGRMPLQDGALVAMGCGGGCVLLFSSRRRLRRPRDAGRILLDGLLALTGLSKAFGDVLSYLRLFALGLASAYLAITFNRLAVDIRDSIPGVGLLLCMLVLLLGHALNLALAVASGVVHGLRLNLIEFLNWSLQGDGYPFRAFEKKEKRAWTAR